MSDVAQVSADPKIIADARAILLPDTLQKRVYFAHAQPVYGTEEEKTQLTSIAGCFPGYWIVNPAAVKDYKIRDMSFYLGVVDECDALVYTKFHGVVMGGVGKETQRALESGKKVYELSETGFTKIEKAPKYLSHEETVALLVKVGFRKA